MMYVDLYAIILSLVFVLICVLYLKFRQQFLFWANKNVYSEPPTVPFGNAVSFIFYKKTVASEFQRLYNECRQKSIPYCGFYFLFKPMLILADLDLIKAIFKTDFDHFTDRIFHSSEADPLSLHLAALKGAKWRAMRNKLSPVFTPTRTKLMFENIQKCALEMMSQIDLLALTGKSVEMKDISVRYSMDVLVNCAFGLECKTVRNQNEEYVTIAESFYNTSLMDSFIRLIKMLNPGLLNMINITTTKSDVEKFFLNTTTSIVKEREANGVVKKDLMHTLLQIRNNVEIEDDVKRTNLDKNANLALSITDIAAQSYLFFMAGFEPASTLITFCLYELALNSDLQDKLRKEVDEAFQQFGAKFCYDLVMGLKFTHNCLKETLRKYPPLPTLTRECTKDYTIPSTNLKLEKGTLVTIPMLGIHYDPSIYPEPEKFDPERFSEENMVARHPCAFLTFGFGPRNCIGLQLGYLESALAVANFVYNFKFKLNPATKVPLEMDRKMLVLRAKGGVILDVEKIK